MSTDFTDSMKPKVDAGDPTRYFTLKFKSRDGGQDEERRVALWVDIGSLEDLRDDPEHPLDLIGQPERLVDLFQQQFEFARVLYMLSDAQDMDPREFARGLMGGTISEAADALRGAFRCFFLHLRMLTHVEVLETVAETTWETQQALVDAVRATKPSQLIADNLRSDDFVSNVRESVDAGIKEELRRFGDSFTQPSDDSGSTATDG